MRYDFVGDVHGHAEALEALLARMGYRETGGAWRQPGCHAVFVGDLVDRGPEQLRTVDIVRRMVEAGTGSMTMGNHEFNAIGWHTPDPERPGEYYRRRNDVNRRQHAAFLDEVKGDKDKHAELIAWFRSLPLWLEIPNGPRVVHACWHPREQEVLRPHLDGRNALTEEGVHAVFRKGDHAYEAAEVLLKGLEIPLPDGIHFFDKDNHKRTDTRIRWWDEEADTYRSSALIDADTAALLPDTALPEGFRLAFDGGPPVFFGHYWMQGAPELLTDRLACLDWSVAKGGCLAAYRWDGEESLAPSGLVWVGDRPHPAPPAPEPAR